MVDKRQVPKIDAVLRFLLGPEPQPFGNAAIDRAAGQQLYACAAGGQTLCQKKIVFLGLLRDARAATLDVFGVFSSRAGAGNV